ncbi:hypothetical protein Tco_0362574 [Tanacetum coccineum]
MEMARVVLVFGCDSRGGGVAVVMMTGLCGGDFGGGGFGEMEAEMVVVELWWLRWGGSRRGGRRVAASGYGDRVDRWRIYLFLYDFCGSPENSPERFSGGGWPEKVAAGRREGWPDNWGRWRRERGL